VTPPDEKAVRVGYTDPIMARTATTSKDTEVKLRRLRRLTAREEKATTEKDDLIRELRDVDGLSLRDIAENTNISHTNVARVCGESSS
jgi:DNA-directed RNA polymerase specialized sigma subunit